MTGTKNTSANQVDKSSKRKLRIGWCERIDLPDFQIKDINAKIDTGTKTSAIHASQIREFVEGGVDFAEFTIHPIQRTRTPEVVCHAEIVDKRMIKSSNGQEEERIVVQTHIRLAKQDWKIELTLTNRDTMGFRMLIGRDAVCRDFLIDPGSSYLT